MADDFSTDVALGAFPWSTYRARWAPYTAGSKDTSGYGTYDAAKTVSVSGGVLRTRLHSAGGTPYVNAMIASPTWGQTYGRYSIRMRVPAAVPGYKVVPLLWPDSNNWEEGEIDFPEVNNLVVGEQVKANVYHGGGWNCGCNWSNRTTTTPVVGDWHVYTTEWTPTSLTFFVDGVQQGAPVTTRVPSRPMHLVLQFETAIGIGAPPSTSAGAVDVDWVTTYAMR
jgi:beta-glucanase (GH16 family)